MNKFVIRLAGHTKRILVCDSFSGSCADIIGGPVFCFSDGRGSYDGAWVMNPDDFAELAEAFLAERKRIKEG